MAREVHMFMRLPVLSTAGATTAVAAVASTKNGRIISGRRSRQEVCRHAEAACAGRPAGSRNRQARHRH